MTTTVGSRDDLADDWLNSGGLSVIEAGGTAKAYPKRSELRRAEARASSRRGGDRRPPGSRPPGSSAGTRGPAAPASPGRSADGARRPSPYGSASPRLPIAVAPTASVLPIRQTSTQSRPAGIDLPIQPAPSVDVFHRPPPLSSPVPLAVPAPDGALAPPLAPAELAAPVAPALDPALWGLDLEPAPATGRRKEGDALEPQARRTKATPGPRAPVRLFGGGKAGAARLLVLALVVGAEGVAVTSMAGHAQVRPADEGTADVAGAYEFTALAPDARSSAPAVPVAPQASAAVAEPDPFALTDEQHASSKSKVTAALSQAKAAADRVEAIKEERKQAMRNSQRDPRSAARVMAADRGWGASQFSCLNKLWTKESGWRWNADNPTSSAYGIPQSLPGSKMASAGADWRTNPVTQIRWGLDYIADRYGTPCAAWAHSVSYNNY